MSLVTYRDAMKFEFSQRGAYQNLTYKPVFRASGIFYAWVQKDLDTVISFMNYWEKKNLIPNISAMLTIRDAEGLKIRREFFKVENVIYEFSVKDLVQKDLFTGSIEVELYSTEDLKYAFPAIDVFYKTSLGISFVHSNQRIFNDIEDMDRGTSLNPMQSCFDVHGDDAYTAFIMAVNGPRRVENLNANLVLYNSNGEKKDFTLPLGTVPAYGARRILFSEIPGAHEFLKKAPGFCKATLDTFGVFNRFMCGNIKRDNSFLTLTHSFYDCGTHQDYFLASESSEDEYLAFFPFTLIKGLDAELIFYPIYCKAKLLFSLNCFTSEGKLFKRIENFTNLDTVGTKMLRIDVRKVLGEAGIELGDGFFCLDVKSEDGKIPTRLNFGLNYKKQQIGCNISTSVWMNKAYAMRKRSFAWGPLCVNRLGESWITVLNISSNKKDTSEAEVTLSLYSPKGEETKKTIRMKNATGINISLSDLISVSQKPSETEIWWFTVQSASPSITCNQLYVSPEGYIGGDHAF